MVDFNPPIGENPTDLGCQSRSHTLHRMDRFSPNTCPPVVFEVVLRTNKCVGTRWRHVGVHSATLRSIFPMMKIRKHNMWTENVPMVQWVDENVTDTIREHHQCVTSHLVFHKTTSFTLLRARTRSVESFPCGGFQPTDR